MNGLEPVNVAWGVRTVVLTEWQGINRQVAESVVGRADLRLRAAGGADTPRCGAGRVAHEDDGDGPADRAAEEAAEAGVCRCEARCIRAHAAEKHPPKCDASAGQDALRISKREMKR